MTHEYDDPIDSEQLAETAHFIAARHRVEDRPLDELIEEVVAERFCACVTSTAEPRSASILSGLKAELARQVSLIMANGSLLDDIDEASMESFPASDSPAWINHKRPNKG